MKKTDELTKTIYDKIITHETWWSKIYARFVWNKADNNQIAKQLLSHIDNDFKGSLLDVPIGTAIFTYKKYNTLHNAQITGLDYSKEMLAITKQRVKGTVKLVQGDIQKLPFREESFDIILSMNGFHVFPNKDKAFEEVTRVLKKGGILLASYYIKDKSKMADFIATTILVKKGLMHLPFDTEERAHQRLANHFIIESIQCEGTIIYLKARKT